MSRDREVADDNQLQRVPSPLRACITGGGEGVLLYHGPGSHDFRRLCPRQAADKFATADPRGGIAAWAYCGSCEDRRTWTHAERKGHGAFPDLSERRASTRH